MIATELRTALAAELPALFEVEAEPRPDGSVRLFTPFRYDDGTMAVISWSGAMGSMSFPTTAKRWAGCGYAPEAVSFRQSRSICWIRCAGASWGCPATRAS